MVEDNFNFGETNSPTKTAPIGPLKQRFQLEYPLDFESEGALKNTLEKIIKDVILRQNRVELTIASGATSFFINSNYMVVTALAGITVATIEGGREGQTLILSFTDANITITDTSTGALNTVNLSASFTSTAEDIMVLIFNGTSWREVSRSVN